MWSPISPNLCNSEEKRLHCSPQAQSHTLVLMIGANGPQAAFSKCARMRGGLEWQLPFVEEEPQDVGPELGFGNGNEPFESGINRAPAMPLSPDAQMNFLDLQKGHKKFGIDRSTFVSLSQFMKYVLSGDFIFIFSNLSLKRSIQYLIDGHPRVCNKARIHMMGFGWQDHFLLQ